MKPNNYKVRFDDEEGLKRLVEENYPNITEFESNHMRVLFCGTCFLISAIDKPGGPFVNIYKCDCNKEEGS